MSDEPVLKKICGDADRSVDVIFVHGLTGDATDTWRSESGEFWPKWFADDCPGLAVYSLGYPSAMFEKWAAKEMDMYERAGNVLEHFTALGLGEKPIVFITYSLGGILAKMILRKSCDAEDEAWRRVAQATRLIVFLSTPHTGSSLAAVLNVLPLASKGIKLLANEFGTLNDLNIHFRAFANGKDDLATVVYYEKHATHKAAVVVSRECADPGVAGAEPVAVDKDHITISKPRDRDDIIYLGIRRRLQKVASDAAAAAGGAFSFVEDYSAKSESDRRDLLQKLIDAGREHEYDFANASQNRFARQYMKTGLLTAAKNDHDILLSEVEQRFVLHVYHPLICKSAQDTDIRAALQGQVIDPLANKKIGESSFSATSVINALYYLTEQCHIRWDCPA